LTVFPSENDTVTDAGADVAAAREIDPMLELMVTLTLLLLEAPT
jgi:hypothetical protein